ncbi:MAG: hypothetical protein K2O03_06775 [Lachnospiraceae bacterium]|nr:hypothetical protein [Lachnospiraceae bacterium]
MRKFKNKFAAIVAAAMTGVMALGLVATAAPAVSAYAEEKVSDYKIYVDYTSFQAVIYAESEVSAYVALEVVKDETGTKPGTKYFYPVTELSFDEDDPLAAYNEKYGVVVDLSFLKISKPAYIRVQGDHENVTSGVTTINPQLKKFSMKYTAGKTNWYEAFTIDKAVQKDATGLAAYQYRTLYGSEFTNLTDFESVKATAEIAGTTLIVRKKAVQATDETAGAISAEVKVKVPAAPKAPKVAVDYVKNIVKLPKNVKYAVIKADESVTSFAQASEKGDSLSPANILVNCGIVDGDDPKKPDADVLAAGFSIVVYTPASGKKADSLYTIVSIPKTESAAAMDSDGKIVVNDKVYATLKKTDTGYDLTATGADFGYSLESADSTKWTTVKAGATKSINLTKDTDGKLYVKAMGNKAEGTLPTDAVEVSWFKITSIDVTVTPETIKAAANAKVKVTCTVNAIGAVTDDDKKVTITVSGSLTSTADGEIALAANTQPGEYTVTVTSASDSTVKETATFTVEAADQP